MHGRKWEVSGGISLATRFWQVPGLFGTVPFPPVYLLYPEIVKNRFTANLRSLIDWIFLFRLKYRALWQIPGFHWVKTKDPILFWLALRPVSQWTTPKKASHPRAQRVFECPNTHNTTVAPPCVRLGPRGLQLWQCTVNNNVQSMVSDYISSITWL